MLRTTTQASAPRSASGSRQAGAPAPSRSALAAGVCTMLARAHAFIAACSACLPQRSASLHRLLTAGVCTHGPKADLSADKLACRSMACDPA